MTDDDKATVGPDTSQFRTMSGRELKNREVAELWARDEPMPELVEQPMPENRNTDDTVKETSKDMTFADLAIKYFEEIADRTIKSPKLIKQPKPENWNITEVQKTLNYLVYSLLQEIH
jgi:hypothetical protein